MPDLQSLPAELAWPITLLIAWAFGEFARRWALVPRISSYALTGFVASLPVVGLLAPVPLARIVLLAKIAFGLILFEAGYRLNLRWLRSNPWMGVTSVVESVLTFVLVNWFARAYGVGPERALLIAALAMATSPATVLRVITESRSSGQVTERILHLSALNCALAVLVSKVIVGSLSANVAEPVRAAASDTVLMLGGGILSGMLMGAFVPAVLRAVRRTGHDTTIAYALAVIALVSLNHAYALSPILATLTFGLVSRNRRVFLTPSQRGFGALGEVLSLLLFVFVAVPVDWNHVRAGVGLGIGIVVVRQVAKIAASTGLAFVSGTSWKKGLLTGAAMMPMSAAVILVLEESPDLGLKLLADLAPLAAASLLLEILGPIVVGRALYFAHEVPDAQEG